MKPVNPDQVAIVETLNNHFSKQTIDGIVGPPEFGFTASTPVNGSLLHVIHAIVGKLFGVVTTTAAAITAICVCTGSFEVIFGAVGIHQCDIVQDRPQRPLAKSIVHFTKQGWFDPHWNALESAQEFLHQMTFRAWDPYVRRRPAWLLCPRVGGSASGGRLLLRSMPLDHSDANHTQCVCIDQSISKSHSADHCPISLRCTMTGKKILTSTSPSVELNCTVCFGGTTDVLLLLVWE